MRLLFVPVRLGDGLEQTRDNAAGALPEIFEHGGLEDAAETDRLRTPFGTLSLYRARKPDTESDTPSGPNNVLGRPAEVIAVEPEPRFRAQATEVARGATVPIRVEPGTAEDLPVGDESVDAVIASLVLCTVPDQAAALAEARRALKPGGELRFYEHVHAERQPLRAFLEFADRSRIWPTLGGGCHPARDTLSAINAAGFTVERCERFGFSPSPLIPKIPHILGVARRA
jgi:SAM-dependent methyltransferase